VAHPRLGEESHDGFLCQAHHTQERPALCDVPELQDQLVVFTQKDAPSPFYGSFIAGKIKLDIRRLRPADVIIVAPMKTPGQPLPNCIRPVSTLRVSAIFRSTPPVDINRFLYGTAPGCLLPLSYTDHRETRWQLSEQAFG
jgi:hypothetical protein